MKIRPEVIRWFEQNDIDITGMTQEQCDNLIEWATSDRHPSPASPQWETATPGCDGADY